MLLLPVGLRLYLRRQQGRQRLTRIATASPTTRIEKENEFTAVERTLAATGYTRYPWETLREWVERLQQSPTSTWHLEDLLPILTLHYRSRYDPQGITEEERQQLQGMIQSWLVQSRAAAEEQKNRVGNPI